MSGGKGWLVVAAFDRAAPQSLALPIRRRLGLGLYRALNYAAVAIIVGMLGVILAHLVAGSMPAWHWSTFVTVSQGLSGGLANAMVGTLWLSALTLLLVVPVGVASATYVVMYTPAVIKEMTLFVSDVLAGVPSIVFGYVGYVGLVIAFGWGFSALAAAITLSAMVLPYMIRHTYLAIGEVPKSLLEQATALGFQRSQIIWRVLWPSARRGIIGGALLSIAMAMGETAPLIYTASWSDSYPSLALTHHPVGYLTYVVWTFIQQPYPQAIALAYMTGLLLVLFVAVLAVAGRLIRTRE
jgi:phosphate transport system permease protein